MARTLICSHCLLAAVAKVFVHNLKMNCLMLSYRGYGLSEGKPSEKGIKVRNFLAEELSSQGPPCKPSMAVQLTCLLSRARRPMPRPRSTS
jgi:hypothetical protein